VGSFAAHYRRKSVMGGEGCTFPTPSLHKSYNYSTPIRTMRIILCNVKLYTFIKVPIDRLTCLC
jgi:hypothetical protein